MTALHKAIFQQLFNGARVLASPGRRARVLDASGNPVFSLSDRTYTQIKWFLRRDKRRGAWVLDLRAVRKSHGGSWIKQFYIKQHATKKADQQIDALAG